MSLMSNFMLFPLSAAYAAVSRARIAAYGKGLLPVTKLDVPVISVGNITTGGTGKTPLVEWVSRVLLRDRRKVCILTRGYGRTNSKTRVVVSNGSAVLANAFDAGDEPLLLAEALNGLVAVVSDPDRISAGQWAIKSLGTEVFVLDDGFQHLRMSRDLNILTIDATNPWGGGHLLPTGRLREHRRGVMRADCVVITRANQSDATAMLTKEIQQLVGSMPIFRSQMKFVGTNKLASSVHEELAALPQPVVAFCALGNPDAFFDQLRRLGLNVVLSRAFPDHHAYRQADVDSLNQQAKGLGAESLVTTGKDAVKLRQFGFEVPCYVLNIEIEIEEEGQLICMINQKVSE